MIRLNCTQQKSGVLPGTLGKWGRPGGGGYEGGPGPLDREQDKQLAASREGDNSGKEQEDDGRINHMAINHLHSSSFATSLYVTVTSGTFIMYNKYVTCFNKT